jgi:hypothetical protein
MTHSCPKFNEARKFYGLFLAENGPLRGKICIGNDEGGYHGEILFCPFCGAKLE